MKTYCFDFDGTIADTLPLVVNKMDFLLKKSGEKEISENLLRRIREEGIEEMVQKAGIPYYKLFFLYLRIKKEMNSDIKGVKMNERMRDVLFRLKNQGHNLGILTSNSRENVFDFLEVNNINIFDFVVSSGILRKEKIIKKLKKKGGEFIYIGDETRDVTAGKNAGVNTVAVSWGLSSRNALYKTKPNALIDCPKELLNISF
jgi:phosphoglycolate phosphatase